ncbi:MAG: insulinase family protein [Woeseiaceae bacterium]|nr:insulinase family protein [Woeseiaceae bacterium]
MTKTSDCPTSRVGKLIFALLALSLCGQAVAALDLRNAEVSQLDNGLTVVLLEDSNFPVVSVQMLYRVGARNEVTGKTGLAHFVEHMAFRGTQNFPDTEVVSRIYARGGEWHGYTWTDETTYYATAPKEDLDLLLRIEADRMARLDIDAEEIEAERGAVLAEMHMYENDPGAMLFDALMFTSFLAHPYRNNTIGLADDIHSITHADVLAFYRQHYHPANAVLSVVGDFDSDSTRQRLNELFGDFERRNATPLPHTREPPQEGARRIEIAGAAPRRQFMIAYRAPAFADADFAAFLVLQEILGGGSGVNFLQNDWGTPVKPSAWLHGVCEDLTTWLPPSAQEYVFVIGGRPAEGQSTDALEFEIDKRLAALGASGVSQERVAAAVSNVLDELIFDVQTTEDAAHQLAFYGGFDALDRFLELPARLALVTADDVNRIARKYLDPKQRTIAWYLPGERTDAAMRDAVVTKRSDLSGPTQPLARDELPAPPPVATRTGRGIPVLIRNSDLSSSAFLKIVFPGQALATDELDPADPVSGYSAWNRLVRPAGFQIAINDARAFMRAYRPEVRTATPSSSDPQTRLGEEFAALAGPAPAEISELPTPSLIVVTGDVEVQHARQLLEAAFGDIAPGRRSSTDRVSIGTGERVINLGIPVAQAHVGYIVAAPAPTDTDFDAYQLLLYVLSHGYGGRLGNEAITRRGLAYYIDARYRSAGGPGWITLATGVDPGKVAAFKRVLHDELRRLETEPPTPAEVEEAKNHLLGRAISAAQSNAELASSLARDWLWRGEITTPDSLRRRLDNTGVDDVRRAALAFAKGQTIIVVP